MNEKAVEVLAELDPESARLPFGHLVWILARSSEARQALEIGADDGYTTVWLTDAISEIDGSVLAVETDEARSEFARTALDRAGLEGYVEIRRQDAIATLAEYGDDFWDIVILNTCEEPVRLWFDIRRTLRPGGLLLVGSAIDLEPLAEEIVVDPSFVASQIGNELLLAYNHET